MVNLKKYNYVFKLFVIFLTLLFVVSCSKQNYNVTKIAGKRIPITEKENQVPQIENFIKPYREHINKDLDSTLAYCPITLDKSGKWQSTIGNLMADVSLMRGNLVFEARENKKIDICLLNSGGIEYLVVMGTTAENATLSSEEKELVIRTVIEANNGSLPLVLGVGGNNTMEVVKELKTRDLSKFAAILSVSPYYNKPTQEGIYQHFKAVAEASPIPVILYNVPGRTSSNMLPATVLRLANDFKNIVAIKEAAGDIVQAMQIIKNKPKDFLVLSGDDMIALPMILAGGSGVISVIGQGFPKEFSEMIRLGLNKKVDEAFKYQYLLSDSIDMIFEQGNPAGIKQVFVSLGICEKTVRLPLVSVDDSLAARIDQFVKNIDK